MRPLPKRSFAQKSLKALKKSSPTILTCIGAVGVIATSILTARATPKALERLKQAKSEKMAENGQDLTRMETIAACWTYYVPIMIAGIATIGSIFGANALNRCQQASLTAAYAFLARSYKEYNNAVKEIYGEEGCEKVMRQIMVEASDPPVIYGTLTGESFDFGITDEEKRLFYDAFSKRYFEATFADILLAELHINRNFALNGGEIPLSNFYDFLGISTPEELQDLAWFVSDDFYFIDFTHRKSTIDDGPDHEPVECWIIDMPYPPTPEPLDDL